MFFSIPLCEGKIQKGRVDLKTNQNFALAHIAIYNIVKNSKCNVYFFIGSEGSGGVKKGYIITDRFGNFNNTIRFNRSNDFCPEDFNKVSLVLINSDDIVNIQSCNTVLRINNSFSPNIPIVAGGNGITSIVPSGSVSGAVFILVDANMHQIDLLNPMYITLILEPISGYDNS